MAGLDDGPNGTTMEGDREDTAAPLGTEAEKAPDDTAGEAACDDAAADGTRLLATAPCEDPRVDAAPLLKGEAGTAVESCPCEGI